MVFIRFYVHQGEDATWGTYMCLFYAIKNNKTSPFFSVLGDFVEATSHLGAVFKIKFRNRSVSCIQCSDAAVKK